MPHTVSYVARYTLLVVGALFPIVNPIGNTPIFLSLTRGLSSHGRATLARMIALNGLILILTSIFIGTHILAFFGISLPVVQVGGGLVVISTGWTLLRQPDHEDGGDKGASSECNEAGDRSGRKPAGGFRVALAPDRRHAAGLDSDRGIHLLELSFRRKDRAHPGRFRDERNHSAVVIHSGVHRRADSVERSERLAPDGSALESSWQPRWAGGFAFGPGVHDAEVGGWLSLAYT
jgi:hypothetical protein